MSQVLAFHVWTVSLAIVALSPLPAAALTEFTNLISFGDSYSETGNLGRFAEAEVWLEDLAAGFGIKNGARPSWSGGDNYSVGAGTVLGTEFKDLAAQEALYRARSSAPDPGALYAIWMGLNDIPLATSETDLDLYSSQIATRVLNHTALLASDGATSFLLLNAWDRLVTPFSRVWESAEKRSRIAMLTGLFNAKLEAGIGDGDVPEQVNFLEK